MNIIFEYVHIIVRDLTVSNIRNKEFINSLTTKEPSIVKKIINEIKYLYKKFTAGSPEARKLLELQHTLEETYR